MLRRSVMFSAIGVLFMMTAVPSFAQEVARAHERGVAIGAAVGVSAGWHDGSVTTTDGRILCCTFGSGDGAGPVFGLRATAPVTDAFSLLVRLSHERWDASFTSTVRYPARLSDTEIRDATLEQILDVTLGVMVVDAAVLYDPGWGGLYAGVGPSLALVSTQSYEQRERLVDPAELVFLDGTREHVLLRDEERRAQGPALSARFLLGWRVDVSPHTQAYVQALSAIPFTSFGRGMTWKASLAQVEAGMLIAL